MTDDLEPRLQDHLRQRASRVHPTPDLTDVHRRVDARHGRSVRVLGAALAIALVAGPLAGWALAQSVEPDRDTVSAAGGATSDDEGGPSAGTAGSLDGTGAGYLDPQMELQSDRTTAEGIRLVVRTTVLDPQNPPCQVDGLVRVGIADGQLIDVALVETAPSHSSFAIAGGADGRPMWVVVARAVGRVSATFPNGSADTVEGAGGVAVLAAYADDGQAAGELVDDVIEVDGLPGLAVEEGPRPVTIADGTTGCSSDPPVGPPVDLTMPEPGEPPADEAAARAQIEELFSQYGGQDPDTQMAKHERPNVWRDADTRFREEHPNYLEWAKETYGVVHEIVFTAPDRASVRRSLVSDDPEVPAPGQRIGEAVLIDGVWKISIETSCSDIGLAGIECDYSIEG